MSNYKDGIESRIKMAKNAEQRQTKNLDFKRISRKCRFQQIHTEQNKDHPQINALCGIS